MMSIDFQALANPTIRSLKPYQPGKPTSELYRETGVKAISLASNENPLGPSPLVTAAVAKALADGHLYPEANNHDIKLALSNHLNIPSDHITLNNGSDAVLELIVKSYLTPDDNAVLSQYAFLTIPLALHTYGIPNKVVPTQAWMQDIPKMIKAVDEKTRVIFLVNPNNPTGTYTTEKEFVELMESVPQNVLVVIDEAYVDYLSKPDYPNTLNYLAQYPNLILVRTFSKVYALAGFRIGYAIASPTITNILHRARSPFAVNRFAMVAAMAALSDREHTKRSVMLNQEGLLQLEAGFRQLGIRYIPSVTNFITIEVGNGLLVYEKLCQAGVIVRPLLPYNLPHHLRVTVGTTTQNEILLTQLKKLIDQSVITLPQPAEMEAMI